MVFQALKATARGSNQRRACRDDTNRDALHHILKPPGAMIAIAPVAIVRLCLSREHLD
jgi:hypothetical protein